MTDRYLGFAVTLEKNMREDDAEATLQALRLIKNVASVTPVVSDFSGEMAVQRARHEMRQKFIDFWKQVFE